MRIVILCEGDLEEAVLKSFLSPYREQLADVGCGLWVQNLRGKDQFKEEVGRATRAALRSGADAVFGLLDLYQAPVRSDRTECWILG